MIGRDIGNRPFIAVGYPKMAGVTLYLQVGQCSLLVKIALQWLVRVGSRCDAVPPTAEARVDLR